MGKKAGKTLIPMHIALVLLSALALLPFLLVLAISFSNERDIVYYGYKLLPMNFSLDAYRYILQSVNNAATLLQAYKITVAYSAAGTVLSVLLMTFFAYPLSQKCFRGRNAVNFFLYFTMLFSGGLVPVYILNTRYLHLNNTLWIYILPSLINPWYVFMMRTFFRQIPEEIHDSAVVDG
ncbi:MAG: carbohydrate ABC transporter permease, partial [Firmicutes bacterium]|nr:carbohydrate ABC transporter permease [Bacillota bacterium]